MAVDLRVSNELASSAPRVLFAGPFLSNLPYPSYALGQDGRFLMIKIPPVPRVSTINVVLNWDVELERVVNAANGRQ